MKVQAVKGTTSLLLRIFIQDSSVTTNVAGLTGLTSGSSGLVCYRARDDDGNAAATAISLGAGTRGTWSSGGFVEKDATNMPGWYEIGITNASLATGSRTASIELKGATNMVPCLIEIELTGLDNQSTTDGGLSKLTSLTFTGANKVDSSVRDWVGDTIPARNVTGVPKVDLVDWLGVAPLALTSQQVQAVVPSTQKVDVDTIKTNPVVNGGTITFPANATLASTALLPTALVGGRMDSSLGAIAVGVDLSATMKTSVQTAADAAITANALVLEIESETDAIQAKTDNLPASPAAVGSAMTLTMTQAVPTSNAAETVGDALNAARAQGFGKWAISGSTLVLYASDGTTAVRTFTLDNSTAPTSRT